MSEASCNLSGVALVMSDFLDLVSPKLSGHHRSVAYIAMSVAERLGLPSERKEDIMLASLTHDIGALSVADRMEALDFEFVDADSHARAGSRLIAACAPLSGVADIVARHHEWHDSFVKSGLCADIALSASIVHLADRVSILLNDSSEPLSQRKKIIEKISKRSGGMFNPRVAAAFIEESRREAFWFGTLPEFRDAAIARFVSENGDVDLSTADMLDVAKLFCRIIDYRSSFTAAHSAGVAACASAIGGCLGLPDHEKARLETAGYMHDIGKMAVPSSLIEKRGGLADEEFNIVKSHAFYTYHLLDKLPCFSVVRDYAAMHHEKINGTGYPFKLKGGEIPTGARIVAVADVFTALSEDRPFRKALALDDTIKTIDEMASDGSLDGDITRALKSNLSLVDSARAKAQRAAIFEYRSFEDGRGKIAHSASA